MKSAFALLMSIIMLLIPIACDKTAKNDFSRNEPSGTPKTEAPPNAGKTDNDSSGEFEASGKTGEENAMINISITFNGSAFSAKLYDNETTKALIAQFPMTLRMAELNGNEKYYYFADNLPAKSNEKPAAMNAGDIMLWQGNCLVLFYKTFSNSYGGYDRLGYVEDASGLAAALGSGNLDITFELSD